MLKRISIEEYLKKKPYLPLIDVRTPAEFESGHIPGAKNVALFSNEERARVGTVYKQESQDLAYDLGAEFVIPKLNFYVEESKKIAIEGKVAVYCWRGGMRSKSFAEHIELNGVNEVFVIEGGYKAFRNHALDSFSKPDKIYILGGYTGSGKTMILHSLKALGEQVIDLEGIANHKGSAFGSIGQDKQPQNEHFTNLLYWQWKDLDFDRPVWLEDESIHIGRVYIPEALFQRMRDASVYFLTIPKEERAKFLVEDYVGVDKEPLIESVHKISKRLGGLKTSQALEALARDDYYETAIITLDYYDKYYFKGVNRREQNKVVKIEVATVDAEKNAVTLLDHIR
ncbi:MAG: tRNA 2-selenouridine(34) synthase MnmH [Bacteroidales bacterium]|jgi:tRNA 2-selenouridine synthase|nr:tRNA 2-selenouridine(34) synthase MnmH [Bacteroidales bacterium]